MVVLPLHERSSPTNAGLLCPLVVVVVAESVILLASVGRRITLLPEGITDDLGECKKDGYIHID